jgi:hypothetical protein
MTDALVEIRERRYWKRAASSLFSLAKRAMVLPGLFRIEPFIGLAQPIPLKPVIKPRHRLGAVEKRQPLTYCPLSC